MFPDKVLRAINTFGCTTFAGVPTVIQHSPPAHEPQSSSYHHCAPFFKQGGACPESVERCELGQQQSSLLCMARPRPQPGFPTYRRTRLAKSSVVLGLPDGQSNESHLSLDDEGRELPAGKPARSRCAVRRSALDTLMIRRNGGEVWRRLGQAGDFACRDDDGYLWVKDELANS